MFCSKNPPLAALMLAASALALLAADSAVAQPGGRGGFGQPQGGVGFLLSNDAVRGEIGVTDDQVQELEVMRDEIRDEMRDRMRSAFQNFRDMSPEERDEARDRMRQEMQDFQADVETRISGVLSESQMQRLKQIEVQQQMQRGGLRGMLRGELAEKLGITEEQQEQLRAKAEEEQEKLQQQVRKLTEEARERVLSVLSQSQRDELNRMMGKSFEMPEPEFGRVRFDNGNRRRGGRGGARPELE